MSDWHKKIYCAGRCAVCVVQRKGVCGTQTAPKKCLRRLALEAAGREIPEAPPGWRTRRPMAHWPANPSRSSAHNMSADEPSQPAPIINRLASRDESHMSPMPRFASVEGSEHSHAHGPSVHATHVQENTAQEGSPNDLMAHQESLQSMEGDAFSMGHDATQGMDLASTDINEHAGGQ